MYKAMIVDDETVSQEYIRSLIPWETYGFALMEPAYSAAQAKDMLEQEGADIVILDIFMPGESGVSLSSYIARQHPQTMMLALSSHDDYDYVRQVMKNGAHDYMLKNRLDSDSLVQSLQSMCAKLEKNRGEGDALENPVYRWLFMNGEYPYKSTQGSCGVMVARLPELVDRAGNLKENIVKGILDILQKSSRGIGDAVAVFREPDVFVSLFLFPGTLSQNKMLGDMFLCTQHSRELVRQLYKMEYITGDYPILSGYQTIPQSVGNALEILQGAPLKKQMEKPVMLPLKDKRRFLAALEEHNQAEADFILEKTLVKQGGSAGYMLAVTNEFLDMLLGLIQEQESSAGLHKAKELEWARNQPAASVAGRLSALTAEALKSHNGSDSHSGYIQKALEMIETSYQGDVSQDTVAAALGLSSTYFSRLFKQETGMNFVETLNRRRIDTAKLMLNNGKSIKETALDCGFKRYNYFITVFKQYSGMTPSDYVKRK